jgi:hypothetical protein
MRVIRSRLIVRGAESPLLCAEPLRALTALVGGRRCAHQSRKSGAMYESGAKYKLRKFRAMNSFLNVKSRVARTEKKMNQPASATRGL